ncbi:GerAB/ArcD/ProY family transporter [Cohnella cholangitidis]|uniref:GerAB/ArcD/ProY family transporter n=1 Tax=Cohnella cholangitidis TaxID=2598458 RepID=A0A7G5C1N7_9BACL|nr:endospore germination permease [Cohnella cholangitidis]QMV43121.1 GerAB/ArcD/ProY family transporter [Cohnella cholangitidis]
MANGKISVQQLAILVILVVIGDSILIAPSLVTVFAKEDAWISGVIGVMIGVLIAGLLYAVSRMYPQSTLIEFNRTLLGRWLGGAVSSLIIFYFLISTCGLLREVGDFITTQMMPETPIRAIHLLLILLLVWALRSGIVTISLSAELLFPWFIVFLMALLLCLLPQVKMDRLQPMLGHGWLPVFHGSVYVIVFPYAEMIIFLMLFPLVDRKAHTGRDYFLAAAIGGLVLISVIIVCILVLGSYITAHQVYPTYALAKKISIGRFFERVEAFLALIWIISTFFKTILYGYGFVRGFSQLFGVRDDRTLIMPAGFLFFGIAYAITPNVVYYNDLLKRMFPLWDFANALLLPLLLIAVHLIRKKRADPA